jgi:diaminopimelate decarboxylase
MAFDAAIAARTPGTTARTPAARAWRPRELPPLLAPGPETLLFNAPQRLFDWVARFGSPLNLVWPAQLQANVDILRRAERRHGLPLTLFYAAKANKSQALVRAAVAAGIGVDVSSEHEFNAALRAGANPATLCATGPVKPAAYLRRLLDAGSLVAVDSLDELAELQALAWATPRTSAARVLLRCRPGAAAGSRFGLADDELAHAFRRLAGDGRHVQLEGLHAHLSGYSHVHRAEALAQMMAQAGAARALGLHPRLLDIGGGLPVRYVDPAVYESFLQTQGPQHYRHAKVPAAFYPYGGGIDAGHWLDLLLESPGQDGQPLGRALKSQDLALALEPGRSLVDQAGVSVFRIARVKAMPGGQHVLFVEGSSFSACETWFGSEFLVDPVLITPGRREPRTGGPVRAWVAGHSCLDDDVLTNRLLAFDTLPQPGDLLAWANTAGYQMDLLENEFHRHPMPRRLSVIGTAEGSLDVQPDDMALPPER